MIRIGFGLEIHGGVSDLPEANAEAKVEAKGETVRLRLRLPG